MDTRVIPVSELAIKSRPKEQHKNACCCTGVGCLYFARRMFLSNFSALCPSLPVTISSKVSVFLPSFYTACIVSKRTIWSKHAH